MKFKDRVLLLSIILLLSSGARYPYSLAAQIVICQIQAIQITRRNSDRLNPDLNNGNDQSMREMLSALWLDPGNVAAHTYCRLFYPYFYLLKHSKK